MEPIREIDYKARVTELSQAIEENNLDKVEELCEGRADVFEPSRPCPFIRSIFY